MHTVPDFFRRKSPEHIVCKLFLSADSVLNDFIGRILQMDFHMLPVLLVGFSGIEGGSDFVNTFLDPEGNFFASGKENKYTNSHSCL